MTRLNLPGSEAPPWACSVPLPRFIFRGLIWSVGEHWFTVVCWRVYRADMYANSPGTRQGGYGKVIKQSSWDPEGGGRVRVVKGKSRSLL